MQVKVVLEDYEMEWAAMAGIRRMVESYKSRDCNRVGSSRYGWGTDIEACAGEMAVAKMGDLYWSGKGKVTQADVGDLQVRHTEISKGCCIIKETDRSEDLYVLVTGEMKNYIVRGWIVGADAKKEEFWREEGENGVTSSAWFVPQKRLNPIDELVAVRYSETVMAYRFEEVVAGVVKGFEARVERARRAGCEKMVQIH